MNRGRYVQHTKGEPMIAASSISLENLQLSPPKDTRPLGTRVFEGLISLASSALSALHDHRGGKPLAVVGRLRGTGRGVSLSGLLAELDREHPIELVAPFEGSQFVSGAVWYGQSVIGKACDIAVAKLRWAAGALDLPMHVHDFSDRFIIVRKGRGYFHVSDESPEAFTGCSVRTIPARERDVFMFSRGVVHTFSTDKEPMELLSCQAPFVPFEDPDQYRLPPVRWVAGERPDEYPVTVACDPGWMVAFHEFGVVPTGSAVTNRQASATPPTDAVVIPPARSACPNAPSGSGTSAAP